jgi:hypothetical protein
VWNPETTAISSIIIRSNQRGRQAKIKNCFATVLDSILKTTDFIIGRLFSKKALTFAAAIGDSFYYIGRKMNFRGPQRGAIYQDNWSGMRAQ